MVVHKQKISLFLIAVLCLMLNYTIASADEFNLNSAAAFLMDMKTGQVMYEKNADEQRPPASTTKIITAMVALEMASLDTEMKASNYAVSSIPRDYVRAGIRTGEMMTMHDLLHFLMIVSANDAGNVIAENISPSGNIQGFLDLMNEKVHHLGLSNSHFTNTYGLDEDNHYSSARDLAIIAQEAMKSSVFRELVVTRQVPLPDTNLRSSSGWERWLVDSTNRLLNSTSNDYSRVTGIKTGYTGKAGRCLVFSAINDEGLELVGVILGAENSAELFSEAQALLEYGFQSYREQTLVSSGEHFGRYAVMDAVDSIPVEIQTLGTVSHLLPTSHDKLQTQVSTKETLYTPFSAPIEKGQILGFKTWYYQGKEIGSVQLVAMNDIEKTLQARVRDRFQELVDNNTIRNASILFGAVVAFFILLRIVLKSISRRRNYRRHYKQ